MCVLASHKVNPLIVPPSDLRNMLLCVKKEIHSHLGLEHLGDPDVNIWTDYSIMFGSPIVGDDFLIVILSILLIDKSLQMDLYSVYNLPAHYPELKV